MVDHSFLSRLLSSGWNVLFCSLWRHCAWYPACQGGVRWFLQDLVWCAGSHTQRFLLFPWRLCLCLPPHYRPSFNLPAAGSRGVAEGWREALWKKKWIPRSRVGVTNDLWCVPFLLQYTRNWQGYFGCSLHPPPCCPISGSCLPSPSPPLATSSAGTSAKPFQHGWVLPQPEISFSYLPWNHSIVAHLFYYCCLGRWLYSSFNYLNAVWVLFWLEHIKALTARACLAVLKTFHDGLSLVSEMLLVLVLWKPEMK